MTKTMTNGLIQLTSTPRPVTRTSIQLNSIHGPNMVTLWEDDQPTTPSTWTVDSSMSLDMPKVSPEIYRFEIRIEQLLKIGPLIQSLLNGRRVEKWETPDGSSVKIESRDILYNYNSPQSFIVPQEWNRMSRWFRKISISNANFIFDKNCLKTELPLIRLVFSNYRGQYISTNMSQT